MPDLDLPVSGKDTQILISVDGVLVNVVDKVTSFNSRAVYDEIETKGLGTTERYIDKVPTGWEGDIELAVSRRTIDEIIDTIHAAQRARVPVLINIRSTTTYRNLTSKSYTYPDCKLDFESRERRGEARTVTLGWKTGLDRIAL